MNDVVNLRRFRKQKARDEAQKQAEANRIAHGRTKAERRIATAEADAARRHIDGHKLEKNSAAPGDESGSRKS